MLRLYWWPALRSELLSHSRPVKTVTRGGASRLDVPSALPQGVQTKLVSDLGGVHGVGQILLVGVDKEKGVAQLILVEHALELLTGLNNTVAIVGVNDEDDTLGVLEVMPPQRADLVLSADIPHGELNVLVLDGLDVEPIVGMVVTISPSLSLYRMVV